MYLRAWFKNGFKAKTILFYPDLPRMWSIVYPISHILGYTMTNDPKAPFDMAMAFETVTVRTNSQALSDLSKRYNFLNAGCGDITKERVDRIFLESFGYGISIDPRTYQGAYVKKPNLNAEHYGEILNQSSQPEKGFVYQKLINSQTDKDSVTDIRTFIFGSNIPFTLYRKRSIHDRFDDNTIIATRVDTDAAFTKEEQENIIRFCKAFGLDYGELDILRDNKDGKIYIVDVNNTPSGPRSGVHMKKENYDLFLKELTQAFEKMVMENSSIAQETPLVVPGRQD
jgi:hypothetical protein